MINTTKWRVERECDTNLLEIFAKTLLEEVRVFVEEGE
jgi:hypothetical protein